MQSHQLSSSSYCLYLPLHPQPNSKPQARSYIPNDTWWQSEEGKWPPCNLECFNTAEFSPTTTSAARALQCITESLIIPLHIRFGMFIYNFYSFPTHSQLSWYGFFVMHVLLKREGVMPWTRQTWLQHDHDTTSCNWQGKLKWNSPDEYRNEHTPHHHHAPYNCHHYNNANNSEEQRHHATQMAAFAMGLMTKEEWQNDWQLERTKWTARAARCALLFYFLLFIFILLFH